ncbi:MAG: hypothetical protein ACOYKM_06655 [Caulobacterales bacterium]|jgi:hypothetical protein
MNLAKYHPDKVFEALVLRLPRNLQAALGVVFLITAWVSVINSSLSILTDRQWIQDLAQWVFDHAIQFQEALRRIGAAVHQVVSIWRQLMDPIFSLLFGWLHIDLPTWVKDLFVILLIYVSAWLRGIVVTRAGKARVFAEHANAIDAALSAEEKAAEALKLADRRAAKAQATLKHLLQEREGLNKRQKRLRERIKELKGDADLDLKSELKDQLESKQIDINRNSKSIERRNAEANTAAIAQAAAREATEVTHAELTRLKTEAPQGWVEVQRSGRAIRRRALWISMVLSTVLAFDFVYTRFILQL